MPASSLHVVVVGGGLGGLCLAQGLRRAGVSVAVYERDRSATAPRTYRISIDARGVRGLRQCLPPPLFDLFLATTGDPGRRVTVVNERMRQLQAMPLLDEADADDPADRGAPVNRLTLREVLLAGLDDAVSFGKEFTRYERRPNGAVRAHFEDGTSATGDVLVAADGVGSRVRQQLLPEAGLVDTGIRCVHGRMELASATRARVPAPVRVGFTAVIGRNRQGMALGLVELRRRPEEAAAALVPGVRLRPQPDYLMWVLTAPASRYPGPDAELGAMGGAALRDVALDLTEGWHEDLREVVRASDPADTAFVPVCTSTPVEPWEATNVTLLGDAIHAMSPVAGSGANTALLDAGLLSADLAAAALGRRPLLKALRDYELRMVGYGFEAVRAAELATAQLEGHGQPRVLRWLAEHLGGQGDA